MNTYNQKLAEMNKAISDRKVKYKGKERTYYFSNLNKTLAKLKVDGQTIYGKISGDRFIKNRAR